MVVNAAPHYLLISESQNRSGSRNRGGRWRFVLEQIGGNEKLVVADSEPDVAGERLQLLTVIRGLEALDQPSRVTLLTSSKYVCRGIRRGLPQWRENDWQWERFGQMCKINDLDLWQRLNRALQLHTVDCRNWRLMNSPYEMEPLEPSIQIAYNRDRMTNVSKLIAWNAKTNGRNRRPPTNRIASVIGQTTARHRNDSHTFAKPRIDGPRIDGPRIDGPRIDGPRIVGPTVVRREMAVLEQQARRKIPRATKSRKSSPWKSWFQQWNRLLYAIPTLIL